MIPPSVPYRTILLSQGQIAYVSPHRYEELMKYKWHAVWKKNIKNFYASRCTPNGPNGEKYAPTFMHRQILGLERGDPRTGDHKDRARTLDNTDKNLRIATRFQQNCNQGLKKSNTSGYKGIFWVAKERKWVARIQIKGKKLWIGRFDRAEDAYFAYCEAAKTRHGVFANNQHLQQMEGV